MTPWRQLLLSAYTTSTIPARWLWMRRAQRRGKAPIMVLFYHRVADYAPNPWTISTAMFRRQMEWLKRGFELISLEQAQQRIASGYNDRPAVSITFDDGYADNSRFALPLLLETNTPFTYFVTLKNILDRQPFVHDIQRGEPLPPNSPEEIQTLARAGVEIGAHTRTHADIGRCHGPVLHDEVVAAGKELSELAGRPVRYFAFPFGQHANMTAEAFQVARSAGYQAVCSAYGGYNFPGDDPFHLQRIHADPNFAQLKNWLTVDARKIRITKRFVY